MATEDPAVQTDASPDANAHPDNIQSHSKRTRARKKKVVTPKAKGKKSPAAKKPRPRTASSHPSYKEMINDAIVSLKERNGSSQYAISRFIEEKHKQLPANFRKLLLLQLKRLVSAGVIVKVKASFKLPAKSTTSAGKSDKKKPAAVKSKVPAKKKTTTKSSATKTSSAKAPQKTKSITRTAKSPGKKVASKAQPRAKVTVAKRKVAAKPKGNEKPAKVARTTTRSTPSKKVAKTVPKKAPVKVTKAKSPAKKAGTKRSRK